MEYYVRHDEQSKCIECLSDPNNIYFSKASMTGGVCCLKEGTRQYLANCEQGGYSTAGIEEEERRYWVCPKG